MTTLHIFGDSFSVPFYDQNPRLWTQQLARLLSPQDSEPVVINNRSLVGSAQDHTCAELSEAINIIKPDDYVVITLTEPDRYWYFLERPDLSNSWIIDIEKQLEPEQIKAIELYIKHIQNFYIDQMRTGHRLTWLAYQVARRGLRRPVILQGFPQDLGGGQNLEELLISQGTLFAIQNEEYVGGLEKTLTWRGVDPRYNHLCLINHDVLAHKVFDTLVNGQPLDLKEGFHREIIDIERAVHDQDFAREQLFGPMVERLRESYFKKDKIKTWRQRVGLD